MFKRSQPGVHIATQAGRTYELRHEAAGTRNRQWVLSRIRDDGTRASMDVGIATIAVGERALAFILMIEAHLRTLGATEGGHYGWTLETRLGPLEISPYGHSVMMRFDDVDRAKVELGEHLGNLNHFNPYSGKWNMHWSSTATNADMLRSFMAQIGRVRLNETEAANV